MEGSQEDKFNSWHPCWNCQLSLYNVCSVFHFVKTASRSINWVRGCLICGRFWRSVLNSRLTVSSSEWWSGVTGRSWSIPAELPVLQAEAPADQHPGSAADPGRSPSPTGQPPQPGRKPPTGTGQGPASGYLPQRRDFARTRHAWEQQRACGGASGPRVFPQVRQIPWVVLMPAVPCWQGLQVRGPLRDWMDGAGCADAAGAPEGSARLGGGLLVFTMRQRCQICPPACEAPCPSP